MIMRRMIVRLTCRRVRVAAAGIGAALGVEWRFDLDDPRSVPLHHRLNDVVAADAKAPFRYLRRQMAIAEVPGDPQQVLRILATNLRQRLWRCNDLDQSAVVEHQRVTAAQRHRIFQIEQKFKSACTRHHHPPPVAIVEFEHDSIGGRLTPAILSADLRGADHAKSPEYRHLRA